MTGLRIGSRRGAKPLMISPGHMMMKAGDMFKHLQRGEVFRVKTVRPTVIILATRDGSHSMFVKPSDIESVFLSFVEDEPKRNPNKQ